MKSRSIIAFTVALLVLGACAKTETTETETATTDTIATDTAATQATDTATTTMGALSAADQEFVTKAASGGLYEVQAGTLATQKAANADVKAFGQRMVTDHGTANQELQQIATAKNITLPAEVTAEQKAGLDHLNMLSGAEFDKAYMEHMVADHDKDVSEFEKASQTAQDPELKAFAAKTLPILQEHAKLAKETQAKLK